MSVPEKRKSRNIRSSILRYFKTNFIDANGISASEVNLRDKTFDASTLDRWIEIHFLSDEAGRKGFTLMQIAVHSRVGGRRTGNDDRYGDRMDEWADMVHDAMHTREIPIYDYSTKASPVLVSDSYLIVETSDGTFREPEEDQTLDVVDGVMQRVLTYRFRTTGDYSKAREYYD